MSFDSGVGENEAKYRCAIGVVANRLLGQLAGDEQLAHGGGEGFLGEVIEERELFGELGEVAVGLSADRAVQFALGEAFDGASNDVLGEFARWAAGAAGSGSSGIRTPPFRVNRRNSSAE